DRAATMSEPGAHLPIAFAMKGTRGQHRADLLDELRATHPGLGAPLPRRPPRRPWVARIDRRAGEPINRTDHGQGIAAPRAGAPASSSAPLPLVREAPFFDEVFGEIQAHHQLADFR